MQKPRAGVHEVVETLIESIGQKEAGDPRAGAEIVAKFLGVGRTTVYKWTDPDQDGEISFQRIRLLTEHFGIATAADDMARLARGVFVQIEPATPSKPVWLRSTREIGEEIQQLNSAMMLALEDNGDIEPQEIKALKLRALIKDAHAALAALDLNIERVEKGETVDASNVVALAGQGR